MTSVVALFALSSVAAVDEIALLALPRVPYDPEGESFGYFAPVGFGYDCSSPLR